MWHWCPLGRSRRHADALEVPPQPRLQTVRVLVQLQPPDPLDPNAERRQGGIPRRIPAPVGRAGVPQPPVRLEVEHALRPKEVEPPPPHPVPPERIREPALPKKGEDLILQPALRR